MKQDIHKRARENINRVRNLIKIYERIKDDKGEFNTDILRAAIVLLHATIEDFLRSISYLRLPFASSNELNKTEFRIPFGKMAEYRDKSVNELIKDSAFEYLERVSYGSSKDIAKALKSLAITIDRFDLTRLDTAISRRHKIVHRADRNDKDGEIGHVSPIQATHVSNWVEEVEQFIDLVFDGLPQ